tara:strand:+ start:38 stop:589 length:552 start_codon:yes stop_codon:yes gene_type:complete
MPITINGNGTITGYTPPIADGSITTAKLANGAVTQTKKTYASGEVIKVTYGELTSDKSVTSSSFDTVLTVNAAQTYSNSNMLIVTNFGGYLGGTSDSRAAHSIWRDGTQLTHNEYAAFRSSSVYKNAHTTHAFLDTGISDTNSHAYKFRARKEGGTGDDIWFDEGASTGYRTPNSIYVMEIAG